jgi:hypothetical protein
MQVEGMPAQPGQTIVLLCLKVGREEGFSLPEVRVCQARADDKPACARFRIFHTVLSV